MTFSVFSRGLLLMQTTTNQQLTSIHQTHPSLLCLTTKKTLYALQVKILRHSKGSMIGRIAIITNGWLFLPKYVMIQLCVTLFLCTIA